MLSTMPRRPPSWSRWPSRDSRRFVAVAGGGSARLPGGGSNRRSAVEEVQSFRQPVRHSIFATPFDIPGGPFPRNITIIAGHPVNGEPECLEYALQNQEQHGIWGAEPRSGSAGGSDVTARPQPPSCLQPGSQPHVQEWGCTSAISPHTLCAGQTQGGRVGRASESTPKVVAVAFRENRRV